MTGTLTAGDWAMIATAAVTSIGIIATVVGAALRLQKFVADEFKAHRQMMYRLLRQRDRAILRIEYYLIKASKGEFQPGVDPMDFGAAEDGNGKDNGH